MKKGQILEGVVERLDFPNKALVQAEVPQEDGSVAIEYVTVKGALPGQRVSFSVKKSRKNKCEGRLRDIIKKGDLETRMAKCPNFGTCGGCNYQEIPYEKQLALKKEQVLRLIDAVYQGEGYQYDGILGVSAEGGTLVLTEEDAATCGGAEADCEKFREWAYRNKMEFSFGDAVKDGPLTLGLHRKGSFHDIVDAEGCQIVHEDYSKVLACVRDFAREKKLSYYHKRNHEGLLRHLLVRRAEATGEMLVALVTSSQKEVDYTELVQRLTALPLAGKIVGILHIVNDSLGDVVQSDETKILYGRDWFEEKVLGLTFKISPFSFFQTNTKGAEVLYRRVREYVLGSSVADGVPKDGQAHSDAFSAEESLADFRHKTVFDLYSGTGTIAQLIAPVAGKVIGVEIVEEAVATARENAARNGLDNCEFIAGDVLKVIDEIPEKPDYIILDPPRDGIHPKALNKIIDYGVEHIVYISCKPSSFARDLAVFQERGYVLERMSNVDLFPETAHVETVCLLSKHYADWHIKVALS